MLRKNKMDEWTHTLSRVGYQLEENLTLLVGVKVQSFAVLDNHQWILMDLELCNFWTHPGLAFLLSL